MFINSVAVTVAAICLLLYSIITRTITWHHLKHVPGPPSAAWSKLWLVWHAASGKLNMKLAEVCSKYGPLTRIGPEWVVCSDPNEIRRIWSIRSGYYRTSWYKAVRLNPAEDNVISIIDNKAHHRLRSQLLPGYSGKTIDNQEQLVDRQIEKLVALINSKYISTSGAVKPCDLVRTMQFLTQDVITAVGFGEAAGYLEVDTDQFGILKTCEDLGLPIHVLTLVPSLQKIAELPILGPLLPKPNDDSGVGRFLGFIKSQVDKRYDGAKIRRNDMLQSFVDSKLTRSEVESEALVTLFGGTDTTSTGIRNTIFYLCSNASAYHILQAEINEAVKTAARPVISDEHAKSLSYLQAVIKEGLRMWPPSQGLMGKMSDVDDVVCGYKLPAGTHVGWSAMGIMRDRSVFGEDADVFNPARWIDAQADTSDEGKERLKEMDSVYSLVFATGTRWECLGKKMAYIELGKVLFELFLRYDMAMVDPVTPFKWLNHGMTSQYHMDIKIMQREARA